MSIVLQARSAWYPNLMQLLFLDESGDHSLAAIDPEYPVFVLGGVLVDADYADRALEEEVAQFKLDTLGGRTSFAHDGHRSPTERLRGVDGLRFQGAILRLAERPDEPAGISSARSGDR